MNCRCMDHRDREASYLAAKLKKWIWNFNWRWCCGNLLLFLLQDSLFCNTKKIDAAEALGDLTAIHPFVSMGETKLCFQKIMNWQLLTRNQELLKQQSTVIHQRKQEQEILTRHLYGDASAQWTLEMNSFGALVVSMETER